MNGKDKPPSEDDPIKNIIQDAFGMSPRECLKEYEEAEEHPDLSPELKAPSNGYQRIKDIIDLEGIPSYAETRSHKIVRLKKIMRPLVAVAIVGSVMWIFGMAALGQKYYGYRSREKTAEGSNIVWNSDEAFVKVGAEDEAYEEIYEQLGIDVLKLSYKDKGMVFEKLSIVNGNAIMVFSLNGYKVYISQTKSNVEKSNNIVSEHSKYEIVHNDWIETDINVSCNITPQGKSEYKAIAEINGVIYQLYGIMKNKESFIKIVEGLSFYTHE